MSIAEMAGVIGSLGELPTEGGEIKVEVRVIDVKKAYGNVLYRITPISGHGKKWVNADRVRLTEVPIKEDE